MARESVTERALGSAFESEISNCAPRMAAVSGTVSPAGPLPAVEFIFEGPVVNGVTKPFRDLGDILHVSVTEPGARLLFVSGIFRCLPSA